MRDLNAVYTATPALYQLDFVPAGFEWIEHSDAERSVISFIRRGNDAGSFIVVVSNFTPVGHYGYRLGVPQAGKYRECLNTDSAYYGGSNVGTALGTATAEAVGWHGKSHSVLLDLPPLGTVMLEWKA
jgi:1,4-alpha-glucan branching enzyme